MFGLFGNGSRLLGLDIGSTMTKAVALERRQDRVVLRSAAMAATPAGVLTEGALTDSVGVSRGLRALYSDYGISENRVAVGVAGERTLVQCDPVPAERSTDLEGFAQDKVAEGLQGSIEGACWGYQPADECLSNGVQWAATPGGAVDWFREAVGLSGRTAVFAEPQICSLANAYSFNYEPGPHEWALIVHVGARHLSLLLMRGWAVAYGRDSLVAKDWLSAKAGLAARVSRALIPHMSEVVRRLEGDALEKIYISGGAFGATDVVDAIDYQCGRKPDPLDPFKRISYSPAGAAGKVAQEHGPELTVAVGLALQGVNESQ